MKTLRNHTEKTGAINTNPDLNVYPTPNSGRISNLIKTRALTWLFLLTGILNFNFGFSTRSLAGCFRDAETWNSLFFFPGEKGQKPHGNQPFDCGNLRSDL